MLRKNEVMHLDMREVEARMRLLNRVILPAKARRGLTMAGNRLMIDAVIASPTVPIRRSDKYPFGYPPQTSRLAGELRASGALFVDGVKKRTSTHYGEFATGKYQPEHYGGTVIVPMSHEACVVFNAPYAAEQHNQWPTKTQPGAGMYFLSAKLYGNSVEYIAIVARAIQL